MSNNVQTLTDGSFVEEVSSAKELVIVDFTAAWCPPCKMMKPILEEIAAEREDVRIFSLDVDENLDTTLVYSVMSMPTFIFFRNGQEIYRTVGAQGKGKFVQEIESNLER